MFIRNLVVVFASVFLLSGIMAGNITSAQNSEGTITVTNKTGHQIYVYDYDTSIDHLSPIKIVGGTPTTSDYVLLDNNENVELVMQVSAGAKSTGHRVYFSEVPMVNSIVKGVAPDAFNPQVDGDKNYSFLEYFLNAKDKVYSVDVSYVDEMSYPVSMIFSNVPESYTSAPGGCDNGFVYGITSKQALESALRSKGKEWGYLIWIGSQSNVAHVDWPSTIRRIVSPDKIWPQKNQLAATMPNSMVDFAKSIRWDGHNFSPFLTNLELWLGDMANSRPYPEVFNTGWVEAFHSVSPKDSHDKYGYYTHPKDDTSGLFDNVPLAGHLSVVVNPY